MRRRLAFGILAPLAGIALIASAVMRHEYNVRPGLLRSAGTIRVVKMETDVSAESTLPAAWSNENGAMYYMRALNDYSERRRPYLLKRGLSPIALEPQATDPELDLIFRGSRQKTADFFAESAGKPRFIFRTAPENKSWPMRISTDPFEFRPYVGPLRVLSQACLNRGKAAEQLHDAARAERIYQAIARMGNHIRSRPGSMSDIELGLELERKAVHYLEVLYRAIGAVDKQKRATRYDRSLERLATASRAKYAQLDNPEAAMRILKDDVEPVWRIEAAVALVSATHLGSIGVLERLTVSQALSKAATDTDAHVRQGIGRLQRMKYSDFREPPGRGVAE